MEFILFLSTLAIVGLLEAVAKYKRLRNGSIHKGRVICLQWNDVDEEFEAWYPDFGREATLSTGETAQEAIEPLPEMRMAIEKKILKHDNGASIPGFGSYEGAIHGEIQT